MRGLHRLLRAPLLHFLLLGALLLVAQKYWPPATQTLRISEEQVRRLVLQWQADTGAAPDAAQLRASLRRYAEEQMLLAEAYRLGLDRRDPVVRERLLLNLRYAEPEQGKRDEAQLLAQARALGMDRSDVVVRRRLILLMQNRLQGGVSLSERELDAALAAQAGAPQAALRLDLQQIFISRDRHGAGSAQLAQQWLQAARAGQPPAGDPFLLGAQLRRQDASDLQRQFGAAFAAAAQAAPLAQWSGPYESVYGLHLLRVEARQSVTGGRQPQRSQLRYRLLEQKQAEALRSALQALWTRYRIIWPDSVQELAQ